MHLCIAYRDRALYVCASDENQHKNRKQMIRCLITVWSIGIARRGLNELVCVKTSKNPCTFTLILPALLIYQLINEHLEMKLCTCATMDRIPTIAINPAIVCEEKLMTWNITNSFWSLRSRQSTFTSIIALYNTDASKENNSVNVTKFISYENNYILAARWSLIRSIQFREDHALQKMIF